MGNLRAVFGCAQFGNCLMMPDTKATPKIDRSTLPFLQASATHGGFFETCRLPQCRRARRCSGYLPVSRRRSASPQQARPP
jgi:hypothetical protein